MILNHGSSSLATITSCLGLQQPSTSDVKIVLAVEQPQQPQLPKLPGLLQSYPGYFYYLLFIEIYGDSIRLSI